MAEYKKITFDTKSDHPDDPFGDVNDRYKLKANEVNQIKTVINDNVDNTEKEMQKIINKVNREHYSKTEANGLFFKRGDNTSGVNFVSNSYDISPDFDFETIYREIPVTYQTNTSGGKKSLGTGFLKISTTQPDLTIYMPDLEEYNINDSDSEFSFVEDLILNFSHLNSTFSYFDFSIDIPVLNGGYSGDPLYLSKPYFSFFTPLQVDKEGNYGYHQKIGNFVFENKINDTEKWISLEKFFLFNPNDLSLYIPNPEDKKSAIFEVSDFTFFWKIKIIRGNKYD